MTPIPQALWPAWAVPEGYGNAWTRNDDHSITVLPLSFVLSNTSLPLPLDDGASITAAFRQLQTEGILAGEVKLGPGNFQLYSQVVVPGATDSAPGCKLSGVRGATVLYSRFGGAASNTGAAVYCHGTQAGGSNVQGWGAVIRDLTIDGTNVPATAIGTGLDYGDQYDGVIQHVTVQNFTSSGTTGIAGSNPLGAVGININNITTLTEKLWLHGCVINNCGTPNTGSGVTPNGGGGAAVQLVTTSGSSTSHMYSEFDFHFNQQVGQNGLVIARQGHLMNGRLIMKGNMNCTSAINGAAAIVLGVGTGSPQAGHIQKMYLDVHVESDPSGSGTTQPWTIYQAGNADNTMNRCHGRLQFLDGFQNSNLPTGTNGTFEFSGPIIGGDTVLQTPPSLGTFSSTVAKTYNGPDAWLFASASGGSITAATYNGTVVFAAAVAGPFVMMAGMTIAFTFTGTLSYELVWFGQG